MLEIQALSFKRQNVILFQNLNVQVNFGELLQVTGANGAGKTTLLRILANLLKPSGGDVRYVHRSIYQVKSDYHTHIAYLGHTSAIKPGLTVRENLISHALLTGVKQFEIDVLLEQLNLISITKLFAYQLSQGQQRRLGLAKIILAQKSVWILDEPLAALDQAGICQFNHFLNCHLSTGGIAIVATHQKLDQRLDVIKQLSL